MENSLFKISRLKVKRANQHICELNDVINAFWNTNPYRIQTNEDPQTQQHVWSFEMTAKISDEVSLVAGDVIHNLRVALNEVAYELATRLDEVPIDTVEFPIRKTWQEMETALKSGVIKGITNKLVKLIVSIVKPNERGNSDIIRSLYALDIADKYRTCLPILSSVSTTVTVRTGDTLEKHFRSVTEQSKEICSIRVPSNGKIEHHDEPMLHVSIDGIEGLDSQSIIPTLTQLADLIENIIQVVEGGYLAIGK